MKLSKLKGFFIVSVKPLGIITTIITKRETSLSKILLAGCQCRWACEEADEWFLSGFLNFPRMYLMRVRRSVYQIRVQFAVLNVSRTLNSHHLIKLTYV